MRLINTKTLEIEEFTGRKVPRYAILSHTWGNEELTFQDWLYVQNQSPPRWGWTQLPEEIQRIKSTEGYIKVIKACEHAKQNKPVCQWLWADTVCIDKTSSAELSEAINSMFEWYRRSEICYAFLVDVFPMTNEELTKCSQRTSPFRQSRWFRRGWTLQELIAPWSVVFLSNSWTVIGTKATLSKHIATITSIPVGCLSGNWSRIRDQASTAQKMSWAARRETTRVEDLAYCLMGLFEINMPLLYGEGEKAFMRLQEEIIKTTEDLSFLAWRSDRSQTFARNHFTHWTLPPLATSPSQFFSARNVVVKKRDESVRSRRVFTANTGIFIHRPLLGTFSPRFYFAPLNCEVLSTSSQGTSESIWIPLIRRDVSSKGLSRCSFPLSTIVTGLDPSRCRMFYDEPEQISLLHLHEPSPERFYFRKGPSGSNSTAPHRQVGILPIFASWANWQKTRNPIGSYPDMDQKDPLVFNLAEVNENLYHGTMVFHSGPEYQNPFGVHFLVLFGPESNKPIFWNVTTVEIDHLDLDSTSTKVLQSVTLSITNGIFPTARPGGEEASSVPRRDPGLATAIHGDGKAFVQMDNRWYNFRSAGLEETSFDTYISLVMLGNYLWKRSTR